MSTNLVSAAEHLKSMPDQWLAREMQTPSGAVPPYLVLGELQRRQLLRSGAGKGPGPSSTVAQDAMRTTLQQITPPQPTGPPPPPGMAPIARGMPAGAMGAPMPGATPPQNIPRPKMMADGGSVDDGDSINPWNVSALSALEPYPDENNTLTEIGRRESGGNYRAKPPKPTPGNPHPTASGKYQMINDTWQNAAHTTGIGTAFRTAREAPDWMQDVNARYLLRKYGPNASITWAASGPYRTSSYQGPTGPEETAPPTGMAALPESPEGDASRVQPDTQSDQATVTPPAGPLDRPDLGDLRAFLERRNFTAPNIPMPGIGSVPAFIIGRPPEPGYVTTARQETEDIQQQIEKAKKYTPYDQAVADTAQQVAADKATVLGMIGKAPRDQAEYQKLAQAVQNLQNTAQAAMHPKIADLLIKMGMGLLASHSPHFGVALGEAGLMTMSDVEKQQSEARKNYIAALQAGVNLQDKQTAYDEKYAEWIMKLRQQRETAGLARNKANEDELHRLDTTQRQAKKDLEAAQEKADQAMRPKTAAEVLLAPPGTYDPQTMTNARILEAQKNQPKTLTDAQKMQGRMDEINAYRRSAGQPLLTDPSQGTDDEQRYVQYAIKPNPLLQEQRNQNTILREQAAEAKAEQQQQTAAAKTEQNLEKSREKQISYLLPVSKLVDPKVTAIRNALDNLNANDSVSDKAALLELIQATAGGAFSGVRITQAEIKSFEHGRSIWGDMQAKLQKWTTGTTFTPEQREFAKAMLYRAANKVEAKQEAIRYATQRLGESTADNPDWQREHWRIRDQSLKELNDIDRHAIALRDSKGTLRYFDNVTNLPHGTGQKIDPNDARYFLKAAGGDPEMAQALAQHWGWTF